MAFDIGELKGTVKIDAAAAERTLSSLPAKARAAGSQMESSFKGAENATDNVGKGADRAGTAFAGLGSKIKTVVAATAGFAAGSVLVDFLKDSVTAASDLNETINKTDTIFGSSAASVKAWGENAAQSLGLSTGAALDVASSFGNMFTQFGFTEQAAADLATQVVQMSADLGSFNNLPTAEVADRISAAFRGEYDALQQLIPNISAARVEQEALAASGKTNASQLTVQEKAMAVLAIVTRDGALAMGDFAKTSDGFANSQKIAAAELENTKAAIGQRLLPVVQQLMTLFQSVGIPAIEAFGATLGVLGSVLAPVVAVIASVPAPVLAMVAAFAAINKFGGISGILSSIGGAVGSLGKNFVDAERGTVTFGSALGGLAKAAGALGAAFLVSEVISAWQANAQRNEAATAAWAAQVDELTAAIIESGGAWDENVEATLNAQVTSEGMFKRLIQGGIDYGLALRALKGDADAVAQVQAQMAGNPAFTDQDIALVGAYAKGYSTMATDASAAAQAQLEFQQAVADTNAGMQEGLDAAGDFVGKLGELGEGASEAGLRIQEVSDRASELAQAKAGEELKEDLEALRAPAEAIAEELGNVAEAAGDAADRAKLFGINLNEALGIDISAMEVAQLLDDALRDVGEALTEAGEETKGFASSLIEANGQINTATEAGSKLQEEVLGYREAYDIATSAARDNALAQGDVAGALGAAQAAATGVRDQFIATAEAAGLTRDQAMQLADAYGIVDGTKIEDKNFTVSAEDEQARAAIQDMIGAEIGAKVFDINGNNEPGKARIAEIVETQIAEKFFPINTDAGPALAAIGSIVGSNIANKVFAISTDPGPSLSDIGRVVGSNIATKVFGIQTDPNPALSAIGRVVGTGIPNKPFTISTDPNPALSAIGRVVGSAIGPKSFTITAIDSASAAIQRIINMVIPTKTVNVTANVGAAASAIASLGGASGGRVGNILGLPGYASGGRLPGTPPTDSRVDNLLGFANGTLFGLRSRERIIDERTSDYYPDSFWRDLALRRVARKGFAEGGQMSGPGIATGVVSQEPATVYVMVELDGEKIDKRTRVIQEDHARAVYAAVQRKRMQPL